MATLEPFEPQSPLYPPRGVENAQRRHLFKINPNQSPVDFYTILHVQFGVLLRSMNVSLSGAILTSVVFEWIVEPIYKDKQPELFPVPSQDSTLNRIFDTVGVAAGWYWANKQQKKRISWR